MTKKEILDAAWIRRCAMVAEGKKAKQEHFELERKRPKKREDDGEELYRLKKKREGLSIDECASAEGHKLGALINLKEAEHNLIDAEITIKLYESHKKWAESLQLISRANYLWYEEILKQYGNIEVGEKYNSEKDDFSCKLENGEVFEL